MASTTEKGNAFRNHVARVVAAAGWEVESVEVRAAHIKADALTWTSMNGLGSIDRLLIEAKDYDGVLPKDPCTKFIADYGGLVSKGEYGAAWLVSKGPISPDAKAMVESHRGLQAIDFATLQRRLFNIDQLIEGAISEYRMEGIDDWFIEPHLTNGQPLQARVGVWLQEAGARPLSIIGPYGTGKSTFSLRLAAKLAEEARDDLTKRVPIRVPLAEVYDEQSMDGLFGKLLASKNRARNYHFNLFQELNAAGRFVLIFDGFDEMKHGMTIHTFERNVARLLTLDKGDAKIIILGRDTAFHDDHEFRSVIEGVQITLNGQLIRAEERRAFEPLHLRDFTVPEAHEFVRRYLPLQAQKMAEGGPPPDSTWLEARTKELTAGVFDELLQRPVHARMLCQIAAQQDVSLKQLTKYDLYDLFVHHLLRRETLKHGRHQGFDRDCRRRFNAAVAWWLYEQGGASTVTLPDIPDSLLKEAAKGAQHDLKDAELRRELTAGLLVEKREGGIVYFAHRSIQEFLVAEHMIETELLQATGLNAVDLRKVLPLLSEVVKEFLVQGMNRDQTFAKHRKWMGTLKRLGGLEINIEWLELFMFMGLACPEALDAVPRAWAPVVEYIVANKASIFKSEHRGGLLTVQEHLRTMAGVQDVKEQAARFMLAVKVYQSNTPSLSLLTELVAQCLFAPPIQQAETEIYKKGRPLRHQVLRDEALPLWMFLRSMTPERANSGEWYISVNMRRLEEDMAEVTGYSFIRSGPATASPKVPIDDVLAEVQRLAQSSDGWDAEVAKKFIEGREMREHMSPLTVRTTSGAPISSRHPVLSELTVNDKK